MSCYSKETWWSLWIKVKTSSPSIFWLTLYLLFYTPNGTSLLKAFWLLPMSLEGTQSSSFCTSLWTGAFKVLPQTSEDLVIILAPLEGRAHESYPVPAHLQSLNFCCVVFLSLPPPPFAMVSLNWPGTSNLLPQPLQCGECRAVPPCLVEGSQFDSVLLMPNPPPADRNSFHFLCFCVPYFNFLCPDSGVPWAIVVDDQREPDL